MPHKAQVRSSSKVAAIRKRKGIAPRMRKAVYSRDNWRCFYCGRDMSGNPRRGMSSDRVIDHLIPFSRGGVDEFWNYVTACVICNSQKHDLTLEEFREFRKQRLLTLIKRLKSNSKGYEVCDGILRPIAEALIFQEVEIETLVQSFKFIFYGEYVWGCARARWSVREQ